MKSPFLSISLTLLLLPARFFAEDPIIPSSVNKVVPYSIATSSADAVYSDLHLSTTGLSEKAFNMAFKGYQKLAKTRKLSNASLLTICDLSQPSNHKRFYILDLAENKVIITSYVAHGKGSGAEYARRFSNSANSHESSLGFYVTGNTYYGEHGLSLRLEGLERGFNDHAVRRNIVVHGADYIGGDYLNANPFMGRSFGCPAVPQGMSEEIINLIKNGTCLFIYYPAKSYLQRSKLLNG